MSVFVCVERNFMHIMTVAKMSRLSKKIKISIKSLDRSPDLWFLVFVSGVYRMIDKPDADS